jgi:hypothetical protein
VMPRCTFSQHVLQVNADCLPQGYV